MTGSQGHIHREYRAVATQHQPLIVSRKSSLRCWYAGAKTARGAAAEESQVQIELWLSNCATECQG